MKDVNHPQNLRTRRLSVLEAEGYDFELAGARLIGHDAAHMVSEDAQRRAREILESEPQMEALITKLSAFRRANDPERVCRCETLIRNFRAGFSQVV
jgi:predicted nucleotidyltransferase